MLSGRMQPTDGSILFQGQNITGLPAHRISRMGISRSFQINNIFSEMTVRENVEVALTAYHGDSRRWINIASRNTPIQREADASLDRLSLTQLAATRTGLISYGATRLVEIRYDLATGPRLEIETAHV